MVAGLQLYMVIGKRPDAVRFRVLYGDKKMLLGHGAIGNLMPPTSLLVNDTTGTETQ